MARVAPEKIVSFSALNRERTASMFMVLHFNILGERAALQNGCHASFKVYKKHVGFLELSSPCWPNARRSKMCSSVTAQSRLINDNVA